MPSAASSWRTSADDRRVLGDELEDPLAGGGQLLGRPSGRRARARPSRPATCWRRPAIRTWKNSSRLFAKIVRNFTRSRRGFRSSRASWRTRALNSSQRQLAVEVGDRLLAPRRAPGGLSRRRLRCRARAVEPGGASSGARVRTAVIGGRDVARGRVRVPIPGSAVRLRPCSVLRDVAALARPRVDEDAHPAAGRRVDEDLRSSAGSGARARPLVSPPPGPGRLHGPLRRLRSVAAAARGRRRRPGSRPSRRATGPRAPAWPPTASDGEPAEDHQRRRRRNDEAPDER